MEHKDLSMEGIIKNPYTHTLNPDNIKTVQDVVEVLKALKLSINPKDWTSDKKYIKEK